ncbi:MAG: MBL fold metallo-hydrolase [Candidatus Eremiobacteraeota bacterium]|nr:MBL fold metallo-hydrolase [Candidatus Eremiobacteraeota bacterium]
MILEHFPVGLLRCNCIILGDEKTRRAVVVDPGDDVDRVTAVIERHGLIVAAIVATHAHIDHVGGLAALKQLCGAPVLIHEGDVPLYEILAEQAKWLGIEPPAVARLDRLLSDGDRLQFGAHGLRVAHTPGHSPGSICLVLEGGRPLVLGGDTLFAGSIGRTDLWGGSMEQLLASIDQKLLTLPGETIVIPGHGPLTTIEAERHANPFLAAS